MSSEKPRKIRIACALFYGADGRTLLVRKHGTAAFMQPGGKIEEGEEPIDALLRELHEELGVTVSRSDPVHLGLFLAPAANEPGWTVEADLFFVMHKAAVVAAAEIAEIAWIDPSMENTLLLAPLTRDHVLPLHRSMPQS